MNRLTLIGRSLVHYRRVHLGVGAGAATAAAVLIGALIVGQSVRVSLERIALQRLGGAELALVGGDRLFGEKLSEELAKSLGAVVVPMLRMSGAAAEPGGSRRALGVQVLGVDERFWALGGASVECAEGEVVLNRALAEQLGVVVGASVVLTIAKPAVLSADVAIVNEDRGRVALSMKVGAIVEADRMGRFGLEASHVEPRTAYVSLGELQKAIKGLGRANVLLIGGGVSIEAAEAALNRAWSLGDAQMKLVKLDDGQGVELRSERVFFNRPELHYGAGLKSAGVLTYLVNGIEHADRTTPYSMVCATDASWLGELANDQIVINRWLAEDLGASVGSRIVVRYFKLAGTARLAEGEAAFTVARVVGMEGPWGDRALMPEYPGVAEAASARQWDPGPAIDLARIREKDDEYWQAYRGTPKAFITLEAGRALWANRFGDVTAVRFEVDAQEAEALRFRLTKWYAPRSLGLVFSDVRAEALAASREGPAAYFGSMFIGFSFFIIVSAVVLMSVLFVLSIEQRTEQIGLMLAVGYGGAMIRRVLFIEGAIVALAGCVVGAVAGVGYTKLLLWGLGSLWAQAVNHVELELHVSAATVVSGLAGSLAVASGAMGLALRRCAKQGVRELLNGVVRGTGSAGSGRWSMVVMVLSWMGAGLMAWSARNQEGAAAAGVFFGSGVLLLVGGVAGASSWLAGMGRRSGKVAGTLGALARTQIVRRRGRALAVVAMMACGSFLVVSVGLNRKEPAGLEEKSGPGGGFALYAQSAVAMHESLDRLFNGEPDPQMAGACVVAMRVHEGDDASCLNLNRARRPGLLGVDPTALAGRFTFTDGMDEDAGWALLHMDLAGEGQVPAIADKSTALWGLGVGVGDRLEYTDERGARFNVVIVGLIEDSILQGSLIVDEKRLLNRYPSISGYRAFLIETDEVEATIEHLSRVHGGKGLEVVTSEHRLRAFLSVQNTYLAIFSVLGGIGLIVGTVGLGVVVLRNVLERRAELAAMVAMGYRRGQLRGMLLIEHGVLVAMGLVVGVGSAIVAVLPAIWGALRAGPTLTIGLVLAGVVVSAGVWIVVSVRVALAGRLLDGLLRE